MIQTVMNTMTLAEKRKSLEELQHQMHLEKRKKLKTINQGLMN